MRRGTTPILTIKADSLDLADIKSIYITFKQGQNELTKSGDDIQIEDGSLLIQLTQEDTLSFSATRPVYVQLRALTTDGGAIASKIATVDVEDILQEGVIS